MAKMTEALLRPIDGRASFLAISFLVFNIFDAVMSLYFIKHSSPEMEINPFNYWLINRGAETFITVKVMLATVIALAILARIHRRHVRSVLYFAFGLYALNTLFLSGSFIMIHVYYGGIQ